MYLCLFVEQDKIGKGYLGSDQDEQKQTSRSAHSFTVLVVNIIN